MEISDTIAERAGERTVIRLTVAHPASDMIDLRSDTVTRPSDEMREAAADAAVGDDVHGDDPTVTELEARAAEIVGAEAALFVPSGTMGNQIAARVHTERGQEAIADRESHVVRYERAGFAQHSALQIRTIDAERGLPTPEHVEAAYLEGGLHRPETGLLSLENTHNARGGLALDPDAFAETVAAAHDLGVPVHLDGARVFNAAVANDVDVTAYTEPVDSVMFCLSKGLGAPIGSMLAGSEAFIEAAIGIRKLLGGGMRQAGMVAAPGLLALENRDHLQTDHENATTLAAGLDEIEGLAVTPPETNIVLADTAGLDVTASTFLEAIEDEGVQASEFGPYTARFVTHWDVTAADIEAAIEAVQTRF
ncbi:threonine aldolase [Halodesulfurarchaeum formicicum]|uniref:Threonine aldolase n=2 Tax=Halodesulfurarchaeum formicicum TaxID=1873524 RepID=A0A1D8S799_9EURY|nr:threonine aldolase [Halodesulfurarchaeum formicicum]